ncbi:MAG TPA: PLP-dependent aminotransferase family protein [Thermomicrobiales bacterium]|nr:PLP-dependent aminotransferase family protein [Thermomicrobiales bacterium]
MANQARYQQLAALLRGRIVAGDLRVGARLPAVRALAAELGVGRHTVEAAYSELLAAGLLEARVGQGTFVAAPPPEPAGEPPRPGAPWVSGHREPIVTRGALSAQQALREALRPAREPDAISFVVGAPAADLFPVGELQRALNATLREEGAEALGYEAPEGYGPLRAALARHLLGLGIAVSPGEVLMTSGAQQAIDLTLRALTSPGDYVVTESPTYLGILDACEANGVRVIGVPLDDEGMDIARLAPLLAEYHPRLLLTVANVHNPTGITMSLDRRRQLLALAGEHDLPVLEEDAYGELRYGGSPVPRLKALDTGDRPRVIYVSSFSKVMVPGLRLGYLVAGGEAHRRILFAKQASDRASNSLVQRAIYRCLESRQLRSYVHGVSRRCRERRDAMLAALARHFPPGARWTVPEGGLYLWVRLPDGASAMALYAAALARGVIVAPGGAYFPDGADEPYICLNFAAQPPPLIEEGVRRLGLALRETLGAGAAREAVGQSRADD